MGVGTAIGAGVATLGTLNVVQAQQQNRAASRAIGSTRAAGSLAISQNAAAEQVELRRRQRAASQTIGRLRVAAGRGVGVRALTTGQILQAEEDASVIRINRENERAQILSGVVAQSQQISAGIQNPLIAAITGGASGAMTGLAINSAFSKPPRAPSGPQASTALATNNS